MSHRALLLMLVAIASTPAWFIAYFGLGLVTGMFGMCQIASREWSDIYFLGFFLVPPALGLATGVFVMVKTPKPLE